VRHFIWQGIEEASGRIGNLPGVEVDYSANHTEPSTFFKGKPPW
jgi:hypothetical protein